MTTDEQTQADFVAMIRVLDTRLAAFAQECVVRGADPRDITKKFEKVAETARGWCTGRFGS